MYLLKIKYHLCALLKKALYKLVYGEKVTFGKHATFRKNFNISIEGSGEVIIGDNCFFNNDCSLNALERIVIGDDTIFGESVKIYDHNHRFMEFNKKIMSQGYNKAAVIIGKDCWIGSNVVILKGVTIGDNSIIGAGSIITKNIPEGSIVKTRNLTVIERRTHGDAN